jgi:hypothetical protein
LNARVKGISGAVGLSENLEALQRWMTAGPEVARFISEFEQASVSDLGYAILHRHEQTPAGQQIKFMQQVSALVAALE